MNQTTIDKCGVCGKEIYAGEKYATIGGMNMCIWCEPVNVVAVKHKGTDKLYLFAAPLHEALKRGNKVVCETKNGTSPGTCVTDSTLIFGGFAVKRLLEQLTGATFPLRPVIGRTEFIKF